MSQQLFKTLFDLSKEATLTLTFAADTKTGLLTVNVIPTANGDKLDSNLVKPLTFQETPEALEEGFVEALVNFGSIRRTLAEALEDYKTVVGTATAEVKGKTAAAIKTASGKTTQTASTTEKACSAASIPASVNTVESSPAVEPIKADDAVDLFD
jgi:PRTRC genetic system protein E